GHHGQRRHPLSLYDRVHRRRLRPLQLPPVRACLLRRSRPALLPDDMAHQALRTGDPAGGREEPPPVGLDRRGRAGGALGRDPFPISVARLDVAGGGGYSSGMSLVRFIIRWWVAFALLAAILALGTAHAFQTFGGLEPCHLCYFQRDIYWMAIAVALPATLWA